MNSSRTFQAHRNLLNYSSPSTPRTIQKSLLDLHILNTFQSEPSQEIKIKEQKEKIKALKDKLSLKTHQEDKQIWSLTDSLYKDMGKVSSQLSTMQSLNQSLQIENNQLKEIINSKDNLIAQFEQIASETAIKFSQMESSQDKQIKANDYKNQCEAGKVLYEKSLLQQKYNEAMNQINELRSIVNQSNEEKNSIIKQMNDYKYNTANRNHKESILEKDNDLLRKQNESLIKEMNQLRDYSDYCKREMNTIHEANITINQLQQSHNDQGIQIQNLIEQLDQSERDRQVLQMKLQDYERSYIWSCKCCCSTNPSHKHIMKCHN